MPRRRGEPERDLREHVQRFVRRFGLLAPSTTPCGRPLPVSHAHALMLLLEAKRRGERPSQQVLVGALGLDKSTVARLSAKMERAGHIVQVPAPHDGRLRLLRLTARGARVAATVEVASRERFARVLAAVPVAERHTLMAGLKLLNQAVAAATAPESPEET
ncbi:MAG: MarR family winged helix-turn-helix transcriptional regulator [Acidobacteriota bacterium]